MGLTCINGWWYFVMRVPRRFAHVDGRAQVRRALHTDSERTARAKAESIRAEFLAYWEALAAGRSDDAARAFSAAKGLAASRGFAYRPAADLAATASADEILARLEALIRPDGSFASLAEATAILGAASAPALSITEALKEMEEHAAPDRLAGRSDEQRKRWRQPREAAARNFIAATGGVDKPISEITREDAQSFRRWLAGELEARRLVVNTANKQMGFMSDLFRTWAEYHALKQENPFAKLRFKDAVKKTVGVPFSEDWLRTRLLAPGALDGLNEEARDVLLVLVNTGARPGEVIGAVLTDFATSANVPHLMISANENRGLKTEQSARVIPLLGVSLEAARRIVARGGISRYVGKTDSFSAAANKYMAENGLKEVAKNTVYSLRHSFEDRMTEADIDDRIRAELMGHKYERPDYGRGGSLEKRAELLARIAL
ncbi:MAG: tyrosine-type recombinase/integrase [Paracoccus sp. (in: a-proteobacteria)]|nr:tyrosine-type recombinase/integrase [Paracoccus sp. (in: a-proteobacteria)]